MGWKTRQNSNHNAGWVEIRVGDHALSASVEHYCRHGLTVFAPKPLRVGRRVSVRPSMRATVGLFGDLKEFRAEVLASTPLRDGWVICLESQTLLRDFTPRASKRPSPQMFEVGLIMQGRRLSHAGQTRGGSSVVTDLGGVHRSGLPPYEKELSDAWEVASVTCFVLAALLVVWRGGYGSLVAIGVLGFMADRAWAVLAERRGARNT